MATKTYNIGIIGYGFSAKIFHIPFVKPVPELNLYAVVQRTPKPLDDAEKDHPGIKSYRSTEEMLQDANVDAVVITTLPESHFSMAKLALEAGKHVVVEKPFTPTHAEADELIALAKKQNKLITVYQNRRWDSDFVTLSQLIKDGSLGRIVEFETHFDRYRPGPPSRQKGIYGGSAIYDLGAHLIDQAVCLFGMPDRLTGFVDTQRVDNTDGTEDWFTVHLHYNKLIVTAKSTAFSPEESQLRFWVRGDKGSFKKYHFDPQEDQLRVGTMPGDPGYGVDPDEKYGTLTQNIDGKLSSKAIPTAEPPTYTEYYRLFAKAMAGEGDVPVNPAGASSVIRLIELAKESSKLGKTLDV